VPYGHPDFGTLQRCPCGRAGKDPERLALLAVRLGDELARLDRCTFQTFDLQRPLPPFEGMSPEAQRTQLQRAYDACMAYAAAPAGWLYLHGTYGAGKSHLAAAIAHTLVADGWTARYRSTPGLLDAIRAGFSSGTADSIFADLLHADLLVLDDIGAEHLTGWAEERLFRLLNERQGQATVLTSNVHPDDLPGRLASRIAGNARLCWLPVSDYRRLA
jgi:DNA replication protein DnaC